MEYSEKTYTINGTDILVKCARSWDNTLPLVNGEGQTYNLKLTSEGGAVESDLDVEVINLPTLLDQDEVLAGYLYDAYSYNQLALYIWYAWDLNGTPYEGGPRMHFTGTETWTGGSHTYIGEDLGSYGAILPFHGILGQNNGGTYTIEADFPIFEDRAAWANYILTGDTTGCLNSNSEFEIENTKEYFIYNKIQTVTQLRGTVTPTSNAFTWKSQRFLANAEPKLYYGSDYELKLRAPEVVSSKYIGGPGYLIDNYHQENWTSNELEYTGSYYGNMGSYQKAKGTLPSDGTYTYGTTLDTNILIFSTLQDVIDAEESGDMSKAINYYDLEKGNTFVPSTLGTEETATTFGSGTVTSPFVSTYVLSRAGVLNIANVFYTDDNTILTNIKKGLELFGASPYESLVGLTWYPFDVTTICTAVSQNYIYFGSYKYEGVTASKVQNLTSGYINAGTVYVSPLFNSYRDFSPYTELSVWLPYHGYEKLDIEKYIGKSVNIRYYVDILTNTYIIALVANNQIVDTFSGNIGVTLPLSGQNMSEYANNMIRSVMGAAGGVVGGAVSGAMVGSAVPGVGNAVGAIAGGLIGGAAGIATGSYNIAQKPKPKDLTVVRGAFSAGAASYMPQYVIFKYDVHDLIVPDNLTQLYGRPSSSGGKIGSFSGYLKVDTVKLNTDRMTDAEINETIALLKEGIFI